MSAENKLRENFPECKWPSGWKGNLRHTAVGSITINKSRTHVLLAWRAPGEIEGEKWVLPSGFVEPDTTTLESLSEENQQEAAQHLGRVMLHKIVDNPRGRNNNAQNITLIFENEIDDQAEYGFVETADPDHGTLWAQWFPLDSLPPEAIIAFDHHKILASYIQDPTVYPLSIFMSE